MVLASLARGILRDNVPGLATALAGQFSDHHAPSCPKQAIQRAATLVAPHGDLSRHDGPASAPRRMGDVDAQLPELSTWLGHTGPWCSNARGYPAVGPERQGAGSMPAACKISQTVWLK